MHFLILFEIITRYRDRNAPINFICRAVLRLHGTRVLNNGKRFNSIVIFLHNITYRYLIVQVRYSYGRGLTRDPTRLLLVGLLSGNRVGFSFHKRRASDRPRGHKNGRIVRVSGVRVV